MYKIIFFTNIYIILYKTYFHEEVTLSLQILTISIDALGILLSLFSIDSFDNIKLKFIIHLCQAFRTELILLLILLFCVFFFIPFAYRHYLITDRFNKFLCISAVLVAAVLFLSVCSKVC